MTLFIGASLVALAVVLFILQPVVKGLHASLERDEFELTDTEARKRVALLALRDVEYDFLAEKLDDLRYEVEAKQLVPLPWSKLQQIEIEEVPTEPGEHELSVFMEDTVWPFHGKLEEYIRRCGEQYSTAALSAARSILPMALRGNASRNT